MEWSGQRSVFDRRESFFCISLGVTAVTTLALYSFKDSYPQNYVLLGAVTLLIGFSWGMDFAISPTKHLHDQLIGILGISSLVATFTSSLLASCTTFSDWQLVSLTVTVGWMVGSVVDLAIAFIIGNEIRWAIAASTIALLLLGVMLFKAGALLVQGDPDDFMNVIVAMDCTLVLATPALFWVLPMLVIFECARRVDENENAAQPAPAENQGRHEQEGQPERHATSAREHSHHESHEQEISWMV